MGEITYRNRMYTPVFSTWEKLSRRNKKDFDSKQSEAHIFWIRKRLKKNNLMHGLTQSKFEKLL